MKWFYEWKEAVATNWNSALALPNFSKDFSVNLGGCLLIYFSVIEFLKANRFRDGAVLVDPIQLLLQPYDFSVPIFIGTYVSVILFLFHIVAYPQLLHFVFRAFTAVFMIRATFIYIVPLHIPAFSIPLNDPFTEFMAHENFIQNDLFFSGHISDLTIFALAAQNKKLRYFIIASAVVVALLLVWQRVHYSADVLAAPFFAYASYKYFVEKRHKQNSSVL